MFNFNSWNEINVECAVRVPEFMNFLNTENILQVADVINVYLSKYLVRTVVVE